MVTFQIEAEIAEDGKLLVEVPANFAPGKHNFIITIMYANITVETVEDNTPRRPPVFSSYNTGFIDPNYTMRREEMYDGERG
jgi:hypothetical protein